MSKSKIKKPMVKEQLDPSDLEDIRILIRKELAKIFFDLYRKKSVWEK